MESYHGKYAGRNFKTGLNCFTSYSSGDGGVNRRLIFGEEEKSCTVLIRKELQLLIPKI